MPIYSRVIGQLQDFAHASRRLGSATGILSSVLRLRGKLADVLSLFKANATDLFARKVSRPSQKDINKQNGVRHNKHVHRHPTFHVLRPRVSKLTDREQLPEQLEMLAKNITSFLASLNEFPEVNDEVINESMHAFGEDLNVRCCIILTNVQDFHN